MQRRKKFAVLQTPEHSYPGNEPPIALQAYLKTMEAAAAVQSEPELTAASDLPLINASLPIVNDEEPWEAMVEQPDVEPPAEAEASNEAQLLATLVLVHPTSADHATEPELKATEPVSAVADVDRQLIALVLWLIVVLIEAVIALLSVYRQIQTSTPSNDGLGQSRPNLILLQGRKPWSQAA